MSELNTRAHVLDTSLVKCSCGEPFEISVVADEVHQYAEHLAEVTEAAVRETIAADIEAVRIGIDNSAHPADRAARIARGET